MGSSKKPIVKILEEKRAAEEEDQPAKVIEWEDYEQELARLCSLTSALEEAKSKKSVLEEKLQSLIQVKKFILFMVFHFSFNWCLRSCNGIYLEIGAPLNADGLFGGDIGNS